MTRQDVQSSWALQCDPPEWLNLVYGAHRAFFDKRILDMSETLAAVLRNGHQHLLPVLIVTGQSVRTMRREVGKSVWRKIYHASEHTNFLRSLIWLRFRSEANWSEIVDLKEMHLRSCRNAIDWPTAIFADRLAEPGRFLQTSMLYHGVVKLGGEPVKQWSLRKLQKEHAKLSIRRAIADANPEDWCAPFETTQDGFDFTRLTSDRDFVSEGKTQRHCVASMLEEARTGSVVAMRCTGHERATLVIKSDQSIELAGMANTAVSERCMTASQAALAAFHARNSPPT